MVVSVAGKSKKARELMCAAMKAGVVVATADDVSNSSINSAQVDFS